MKNGVLFSLALFTAATIPFFAVEAYGQEGGVEERSSTQTEAKEIFKGGPAEEEAGVIKISRGGESLPKDADAAEEKDAAANIEEEPSLIKKSPDGEGLSKNGDAAEEKDRTSNIKEIAETGDKKLDSLNKSKLSADDRRDYKRLKDRIVK